MTSNELIVTLLHYISEDDTALTDREFLTAVRDRITDDLEALEVDNVSSNTD